MKWIAGVALLLSAPFVAIGDEARTGYILKSGEGEDLGWAVIKISPRQGSRNAVLINEKYTETFSTGTHYHVEADEFFYIVSGNGFVRLYGEEHAIGEGDVVFVPAGTDHALITRGEAMQTMTFLDQRGLDEEFRAWHRAYGQSPPESLEQLNAIANRHGTVYRTLE